MSDHSIDKSANLLSDPKIWDEHHLSLRNEAHQRATLTCDAPAIVWHAAAWPERRNDPQDSENISQHNDHLTKWLNRVNKLVRNLGGEQQFRIDTEISTSQDDEIFGPVEKNISRQNWINSAKPKGIEFTNIWRDVLVQTRVQLFNDFVSATFVISCSDAAPTKDRHDELQIRELLQRHTRQASDLTPSKARESAEFLFVDVWDIFTKDLFLQSGSGEQRRHTEPTLQDIVPGKLFLSLRGVILDASEHVWRSDVDPAAQDNTAAGRQVPARESYLAQDASDGLPPPQRLIERYEHFITNGGFDEDDRDFVVAGMLHERAVFISPFGAKSSKDPKDGPDSVAPRRVTRFTLLTKTKINSHEMGRVVANLTALSTFQIAAIKDINLIRQVGTQIRLAGDRLNDFSIRFSKAIQRLGRPPTNLEVDLCKFETELDQLARLPTGGLAYRVYRSRHYVREFKRRLNSLNFEDLDNWQSPKAFFEKRLFSVFDYIQVVGQRMRNLRSRLYETLEAVQTKTLVDLTSRVHKIHRTGQVQNLILFVIAVSAFFGEIFEPLFQLGRNRQCLPLEPRAQSSVRAGVDIFSSAPTQGGGDVCKPVFRVLGYSYGLALAFAMALIYITLGPLVRRVFRFLKGLGIRAWEWVRLRR